MIYRWTLLGLAFLLSGCGDDIRTYQVPRETPVSPMSPAGGMTAPADMMLPAGLAGASAAIPRDIAWKTPPGWIEQPPSSMRLASFLFTGENGQAVDISVVPLAGEAGGLLANVNRWRGQINLEPLQENALEQAVQKIKPGGRGMTLVDFTSREALIDGRFKKRLVAAILAREGRSWFFKMTGEERAVGEAKPALLEFLGSLRFQTHEK